MNLFQKLDPTWDGPKKQEENLLSYLDKISHLIEMKVIQNFENKIL